jgi:quercetin dioxygenase-like cupin family protein
MTTTTSVLGPADGRSGFLGSIGVRFMVDGARSGGGFALVEHPMSPRALAAPLHRHAHEDEYSYVLEGRVGAMLGDEVLVGTPGDLIFKPRNQWHTFWNAGDEPARILEIISPPGSSASSRSSSIWAACSKPRRRRWPSSAHATSSRCSRTPSPASSSASACACPASRSESGQRASGSAAAGQDSCASV